MLRDVGGLIVEGVSRVVVDVVFSGVVQLTVDCRLNERRSIVIYALDVLTNMLTYIW